MAKERGIEFRVGALIVTAVGVLAVFLFVLGNFSVGKGFTLRIDFNFSGNIQPGAPVKVSGIKVGKIESVEFLGGAVDPASGRHVEVRVKAWVEERVRASLHDDAEFFVNTAGVLGEQYLEIAPGSYDRPALDVSRPIAGVDPPRTDLVVARLHEFLDSITKLLHDDKDLIKDLLKNSASAVANLSDILANNKDQIGSLIVSTQKLEDQATGALSDFRTGLGDPRIIGRTVADLDGTLVSGKSALDELTPRASKLLDDGYRLTSSFNDQRLDRVLATADAATTFLGKAGTLVDGVSGIVTDLRAGKGTAGALLEKEELYADLKEMVRDLRRNPWKFLWKE